MDAQQARTFPHNLQAETAVLEAVLRDNKTLPMAREIVGHNDFFRAAHRAIFACMCDMADRGREIEMVSLCEELERIGKSELVGGPGYVDSLVSATRLYRDASEYVNANATTVAAHSRRRRAILDFSELIERAYDKEPIEEIAAHARAVVDGIGAEARDADAAQQAHETRKELRKQRAQREARRIVDSENTATAIVEPNPIGLDELLARQFPPLEYTVDQLQPKGSKVLFAAQAKAGKTTAVINLIRSLADGEPFLNTFRPAPLVGRVCLLDLEMTDRQLHHWFSQAAIRNRDRVAVQQLRGRVASFNILDSVTRAAWAAKLREWKVSTLIFDNLRPLMDALGLDENSDAGRLLVAFDALVAEAGISESMIVHHMGHNGNRSRGDSRLRDWPDVEWFLTRDKSPTGEVEDPACPRFFHAYGRDVDFKKNQLMFDPLTRRLTLVGGSPVQVKSDAAIAEIYALIGDRELSGRAVETECAKVGSRLRREEIRDALDAGLRAGNFVAVDGPRRAILHRRGPSAPSAPEVRRNTSDKCAAPYIGARTGALVEGVGSAPIADGGDHAPISI